MNYPVFKLSFTMLFGKKKHRRLSVVASSNHSQGFIMTWYWFHSPVLNVLCDRFAPHPSPIRKSHEWWLFRWGCP